MLLPSPPSGLGLTLSLLLVSSGVVGACGGKVALEPGTFGCNLSEYAVYDAGGTPHTLQGTGATEVTVERSGSTLSVAYQGQVTTTIDFTVSADDEDSATDATGQYAETCTDVDPRTAGLVDGMVDVSQGSLSWDGTTLTIHLSGTVSSGSACAGQQSTVSLTCTKALLEQPGYGEH
jgi:hypothetical protein